MVPPESPVRASAVGFCCGATTSSAIVVVAALYYQNLPMPDPVRFLVFGATLMTAASATAFTIAGLLASRLLPVERRGLAIAWGVGAVGAVAWPAWCVFVLGRANKILELAAIGMTTLVVAIALGLLAYGSSRLSLAKARFGLPAIVLAAAIAFGLHATREREYTLPAPLTARAPSRMAAPLAASATNVMLITIDTLRADHLPIHGYERDTAPNLSELADRAIVFENATSQFTCTAPSLATILTGTYPPTHKILNNYSFLAESNVTLAELLKAKGFHTVGATGNPGLGQAFKFDQGFDVYEPLEIRGEEAVYRLDPEEAKLLNQIALPILEGIRDDHFFLWLHYMDPHGPYIVPPDYQDLYRADALSGVHDGAKAPSHTQMYSPIQESDPFFQNTDLDFFISQYDAEIKFLDDNLKILFDRMKELGLWESTLLVITADHGEGMGEHRGTFFEHYDPYHHTVHVPLIFAHPDLPHGVRIERSISLVDIVPTVLGLLGLPPNPVAQGQDLSALILNGETAGTRLHQFTIGSGRSGYRTHAVRTDSHKLIMDFRRQSIVLDALVEALARTWVPDDLFNPYHYRSEYVELYDLEDDPTEQHDIADSEPEVVADLSDVLRRWSASSYYEGRFHEKRRAEITPETDEALRALGYIE